MKNRKYIKIFEEYNNNIDYKDFIINLYDSIKKERYSKLQHRAIKTVISNIFTDKDWYWIGRHQNYLSENFIREFRDKVDWLDISIYQELSEDFIREFNNKIDWSWISRSQKLSEEFIREFQDKLRWGLISKYQILSEDFIREFQDKVDWYWIFDNQELSEEFKKEFEYKLNER